MGKDTGTIIGVIAVVIVLGLVASGKLPELFSILPEGQTFQNKDGTSFITDFCNTRRFSADPPEWGNLGGIPATIYKKDNIYYFMPCARYYCEGNTIKLKQDPRTWASPGGMIYTYPSNLHLDDLPMSNFQLECEFGCMEYQNKVMCTPNTTSGFYMYQPYSKTFTIDYTTLGVDSCNNYANQADGSCQLLYHFYAVLPSRTSDIDDAIVKEYVEISSNIQQTSSVTIPSFIPEPSLYDDYVVVTSLVLRNETRVGDTWETEDALLPSYTQSENITGDFIPPPNSLAELGDGPSVWESLRNFWDELRNFLGL